MASGDKRAQTLGEVCAVDTKPPLCGPGAPLAGCSLRWLERWSRQGEKHGAHSAVRSPGGG